MDGKEKTSRFFNFGLHWKQNPSWRKMSFFNKSKNFFKKMKLWSMLFVWRMSVAVLWPHFSFEIEKISMGLLGVSPSWTEYFFSNLCEFQKLTITKKKSHWESQTKILEHKFLLLSKVLLFDHLYQASLFYFFIFWSSNLFTVRILLFGIRDLQKYKLSIPSFSSRNCPKRNKNWDQPYFAWARAIFGAGFSAGRTEHTCGRSQGAHSW